MTRSVAIIGTGPTGVYTFQKLLEARAADAITLFEKGAEAGVGMPYSPEAASRSMLANIASIEIPPVGALTYLDWLQDQTPDHLRSFGLDPDDLDERRFTPRLLLGEYFRDGLRALVARAREDGIDVTVRERAQVTDVEPVEGGALLHLGPERAGPFGRVVVATGHVFPDGDEASRSYFPSPWSGLIDAEVAAVRVGILGTSLSAIDAAMAVATQHGRFRRRGEEVSFERREGSEGLQITLMSWSGILPEADFYCPLPYEPLSHMTDAAIEAAAASERPLDAAFDLFRAELADADPAYASAIGLDRLDADSFSAAYFRAREGAEPFRWAARNLAEVEHNKAHRITVPWRYAILRMHEPFAEIVPALSAEDRKRFDRGMKGVFVDNYAAVPSESIRRLLALRDAGVLSVMGLGEGYGMERGPAGTVITAGGTTHVFDVFIDARGQRALKSKDLPFPTLRAAFAAAGQESPALHEDFSLDGVTGAPDRLHLAAIPYLMRDRPFVQGITASAEIGEAIAHAAARPARRRSWWDVLWS